MQRHFLLEKVQIHTPLPKDMEYFWPLNETKAKLDMNCDFSSNKNIWARFYEFLWWPFWILLGNFYYDRLIGISRLSCLAAILNCNFRLRTSGCKFQKSPPSFCSYKLIYICLSNGIAFRVHSTHIDLSLCITIRNASPTLKQHWFNVLRLKKLQLLF